MVRFLSFMNFKVIEARIMKLTVKLKRTSDPSFEIIPAQLSGDIGEGKFAGKKNKVIWVIK